MSQLSIKVSDLFPRAPEDGFRTMANFAKKLNLNQKIRVSQTRTPPPPGSTTQPPKSCQNSSKSIAILRSSFSCLPYSAPPIRSQLRQPCSQSQVLFESNVPSAEDRYQTKPSLIPSVLLSKVNNVLRLSIMLFYDLPSYF